MTREKKKKRNGRSVMMVEGEILRQILIRIKNSEKDIKKGETNGSDGNEQGN